MSEERDLAAGEWSVLALIAERPTHGFALARELSPSGGIGRTWSVGRPLVYRALELLERRGLVEPVGRERGARGPNRELFRATDAGRRQLEAWLAEPVDHVREIRSLFLLKLLLLERSGREPRPLLRAQRRVVAAAIAGLRKRPQTGAGRERILVRFRLESSLGVRDFIDALLEGRGHVPPRAEEPPVAPLEHSAGPVAVTDRPRQPAGAGERELAPGEWAVLALVCETPAHGFAIARELSRSGELGSIWALGRPLVYRSLEILAERGMIVQAGSEPGLRGPRRTILTASASGRTAVSAWLAEPVEHLRDGRSLLLLKIVFAERSSLDPRPMLGAQQRAVASTVAALERQLGASSGGEWILVRFRLESARAVLRFVEGIPAELAARAG